MGIQGSRLADQATQLDGKVALVLDSEKNIHHSAGLEGANHDSADNWMELQIFQWREDPPTLVLKMGHASSNTEFKDNLDQLTDVLQFTFKLPAKYPGGQVGLLQNIRGLLDGTNPHGIVETHVGRKETARFLNKKKWARQHEKDHWWTNTPKSYECKVGWTQFSSQYFFKFRVNTGEAALLVVDRHADEYKSAVGQHRPPQQQLYFTQLITLPVRVWMCVQYRRHLSCGDASQERESQVAQPGAEAIHDASPLDINEGSPTGISGMMKKLTENLTQQATRKAADMDEINESVTEEQPGLGSQGPEQSVVSPSEGNTEEEKETSNAPVDQKTPAAENLAMGEKRRTKNKRKKLQRKRKRAFLKATEEVHADAQPQQTQQNDEQSASAAGQPPAAWSPLVPGPVVENVDLTEDDLRSPTSATASFWTAHSPSSRISTNSRNFHTPPPVPNICFTGESDEEGVSEHQESRVGSDSEATLLPRVSREPSQEKMISLETMAGALRELSLRRSSATATPANPTTHLTGISPRSERESPSPTSKSEPVLGATSQLLAVGGKQMMWSSEEPNSGQDSVKLEDGLDDTCAATAHVEARQQEVSPQGVFGITGLPLHPHADPVFGPATRYQSPKKDQGQQRAGDIPTLAEALQPLDNSQASTSYAQDVSSISASMTPQAFSRQLLAASLESAEIWPSSAAAMSASHPQRDESSSATSPTRTPGLSPKPVVTVGHPTQRGAPITPVLPAITPDLSAMVLIPAGSVCTGASPTYAHPFTTPGFHAAVSAGYDIGGEFVSGVNPAMTPGPMMAAVPAGPHGGFAPSPTVAPGYGAYQQRPSQGHQASTPAATFRETGNPASSSLFSRGVPSLTSGGGAYPTPPTFMAPRSSSASGTDEVCLESKPETSRFFWDLTYHTFQCAMDGCEKRCNMWDCESVICPFCGPLSHIMYCGKEHLRKDVRTHWLYCEKASLQEPCLDHTVPVDIRIGPPAIPCKNGWDSPERHQQALWFSTARQEGDYFIFAAWRDCIATGLPPGSLEGRCSPRVAQVVRFDDPIEKDRFRRILAVCLLESVEVQPLVAYMFRLLRDKLQSTNHWSPQLDMELRDQLYWELGVSIGLDFVGLRHACETEWSGRPPRHCRDGICVTERPHLLGGTRWENWFERLVYNEECSHWILRANRTTHPFVKSVNARICGVGFDVVQEERRPFRRGEGWDGVGTGLMEMEGPEVLSADP